jgi:hypothetical protein
MPAPLIQISASHRWNGKFINMGKPVDERPRLAEPRSIDPRDVDRLLRHLTDAQIAGLFGMSVAEVRALRADHERRAKARRDASGTSDESR